MTPRIPRRWCLLGVLLTLHVPCPVLDSPSLQQNLLLVLVNALAVMLWMMFKVPSLLVPSLLPCLPRHWSSFDDPTSAVPCVGLPLTAAKPVGGGHVIDSARSARRACPDSMALSDDLPSELVLAPLPPSALVRESERNPFDGPAHAVPRVGLVFSRPLPRPVATPPAFVSACAQARLRQPRPVLEFLL